MKKRTNFIREKGITLTAGVTMLFLLLFLFSAEKIHSAEAAKVIKPPIPSIQSYSYRWLGKPDPFRPFIELEPKPKKKVERRASLFPISPLQRLDLEAIRVVGIVGNDGNRKAIVEDGQNKFYPVHVGTYIGTNNGIIKQILADRVIVEEKTKDLGKIKVNLITMKLHTSEDEGKP